MEHTEGATLPPIEHDTPTAMIEDALRYRLSALNVGKILGHAQDREAEDEAYRLVGILSDCYDADNPLKKYLVLPQLKARITAPPTIADYKRVAAEAKSSAKQAIADYDPGFSMQYKQTAHQTARTIRGDLRRWRMLGVLERVQQRYDKVKSSLQAPHGRHERSKMERGVRASVLGATAVGLLATVVLVAAGHTPHTGKHSNQAPGLSRSTAAATVLTHSSSTDSMPERSKTVATGTPVSAASHLVIERATVEPGDTVWKMVAKRLGTQASNASILADTQRTLNANHLTPTQTRNMHAGNIVILNYFTA